MNYYFYAVVPILITFWCLFYGIRGLITKQVYVPIFWRKFYVHLEEYSGDQSVSPSIIYLFLGMILPLAYLCIILDKILNIDYTMFIVIPLAAIIIVSIIMKLYYKANGKDVNFFIVFGIVMLPILMVGGYFLNEKLNILPKNLSLIILLSLPLVIALAHFIYKKNTLPA